MFEKYSKLIVPCCLVIASLGGLTIASRPQDGSLSWEVVSNSLLNNAQSVKTVDMTFRREIYNSEIVKKQFAADREKGRPPKVADDSSQLPQNPSALTPDNVASYHWYADKMRWLCERTTLYPRTPERLLTDWARYNGELLYTYDDFTQHGEVRSSNRAFGFFGAIDTNPYLGFPDYIQALCGTLKNEVSVSFLRKESINGVQCLSYQGTRKQPTPGQGRFSRVTISVDPDKNYALVRLVDETFLPDANNRTTSNGSAMIYDAQKLDEVSKGIFIPRQSKIESYRVYQGKLKWRTTEVCRVDKMRINSTLSNGIFERDFPPGLPVIDDMTSPGTAVFVGGNWGDSVNSVSGGQHPPQDIADGTSIEVPTIAKQ
jgi:hypothetical protein